MGLMEGLSAIVGVLKNSPSCLAALMVAALFSTYVYLSLNEERKEMHERQLKLIDRCTIQMK